MFSSPSAAWQLVAVYLHCGVKTSRESASRLKTEACLTPVSQKGSPPQYLFALASLLPCDPKEGI